MIDYGEPVASLELFEAMELEIVAYALPSGEEIYVFEDCTGTNPVIYWWCLEMAAEWVRERKKAKDANNSG